MSGRDRVNLDDHPPLTCWFCDRPTPVKAALDNSILVSREPRHGGPYRIFTCPHCLKDSMCEKTPRGRWFASPNVKVGFLDFIFARGDSEAESERFLKAVSWLRENEERRRYFFERDGDYRYGGGGFLKSLWPWSKERTGSQAAADERARAGPRERRQRQAEDRRRRTRDGEERRRRERSEKAGSEERERADESPRRPRLMTPQEILGVEPGATMAQIERRFYRLAVQYHPDKVHHMGEEFRAEAHKKFVLLQRAYEALKRREEGGATPP